MSKLGKSHWDLIMIQLWNTSLASEKISTIPWHVLPYNILMIAKWNYIPIMPLKQNQSPVTQEPEYNFDTSFFIFERVAHHKLS